MSILETSTNGHCVPRFSIFKPFSQDKVETLKHCFIQNHTLDKRNLPANICADDGLIYQTVYDCRIPENVTTFKAVISFQQHTYGRFAVIRLDKAKGQRRFPK